MKTPTTRTEVARIEIIGHHPLTDLHLPATIEQLPGGEFVLAIEFPNEERALAYAGDVPDDDRGDVVDVYLPRDVAARIFQEGKIDAPPPVETEADTPRAPRRVKPFGPNQGIACFSTVVQHQLAGSRQHCGSQIVLLCNDKGGPHVTVMVREAMTLGDLERRSRTFLSPDPAVVDFIRQIETYRMGELAYRSA